MDLIDIGDLNDLASQVSTKTGKQTSMPKSFLRQICEHNWSDFDKFLERRENEGKKELLILEQLASRISARILILQSRLLLGRKPRYENNIENFSLGFLEEWKMWPNDIDGKSQEKSIHIESRRKLNIALINGDKDLIERVFNLEWIKKSEMNIAEKEKEKYYLQVHRSNFTHQRDNLNRLKEEFKQTEKDLNDKTLAEKVRLLKELTTLKKEADLLIDHEISEAEREIGNKLALLNNKKIFNLSEFENFESSISNTARKLQIEQDHLENQLKEIKEDIKTNIQVATSYQFEFKNNIWDSSNHRTCNRRYLISLRKIY